MKGFFISMDFVATVLITILVVSIIVIALQYWFPAFIANSCAGKQTENVNELISSAIGSTGTYVRGFTVESCMEHVDFTEFYCSFDKTDRIDRVGMRRCYEMLEKGQSSGNCVDNSMSPKFHDTYAVKVYNIEQDADDDTYRYQQISCDAHKGTIRYMPVGPRVMQLESDSGTCDFKEGGSSPPCRLKPGKYSAEIGTYSIKFLGRQESGEAG